MQAAPRSLQSLFDLGDVGSETVLAEGRVRISRPGEAIDLEPGRVVLSPGSSLELSFEGSAKTADARWMGKALTGWNPTSIVLPDHDLGGTVVEDTSRLGGRFLRRPYAISASGWIRELEGGRAKRLDSVLFHVVNFPDFMGARIRDDSGRAWSGRLELQTSDWLITIDARRGLSELTEKLRRRGGYAITHVGELRRADTKRFTREEAKDVLAGLHWFLSFVRGAWTSPVLVEGRGTKSSLWRYWNSPRIDPRQGALSWADLTTWESVREAYTGYAKLWSDPLWQQGLRVAIGQYTTANHPNPLETAIISAQSGLELMGWLQLVESGTVIEADWRNMRKYPANKKISTVLALGSIDVTLPAQFASLHGLDVNWKDGPAVVAGVRNQLIHPRRTHQGVGWSGQVLTDTWLLASSYLELALLFALGVRGNIRNRVLTPAPWVGSTIRPPWVPPS